MPAKTLIDRLAGQAVREALEESPFSQADLARRLGISRPALTARFRDHYAWTLGELVLVGGWLGTDPLRRVADLQAQHRTGRPAA